MASTRKTGMGKGAWLSVVLAAVVALGIATPYLYGRPLLAEREIVRESAGYVKVVATNGTLGFAEAEAYDAAVHAASRERRNPPLDDRTVPVYNKWGKVVGVFIVGAGKTYTELDDGTIIVSARPVVTSS